ncbi:MAG: hypothetical protein JWN25_926 [Verrucomicrobiales bacterium]|nr:hypothetical protein [Verrucomicrobiales bacterium]
MNFNLKQLARRGVVAAFAFTLAAAIWLPCVHFCFSKPVSDFHQESGISSKARQLAAHQLHLWTDPARLQLELNKMRSSNAEWDFMGRTFLVWSLVDMGLREPQHSEHYLQVIDKIIRETLKVEEEQGIYTFLMPYAKGNPFKVMPARSLFLDGEVALIMGARRMLKEEPAYILPMTERLKLIEERLKLNPLMAMESYPDECWTFDHAVALAAYKVADRLDGTDHSELCNRWIALAKEHLLDKQTGVLISSYKIDGTPIDGPEGSTIWMVAHCLQIVDEPFARDQYQRARKELGRTVLGFGYGVEWPSSWHGSMDVDSGAIVPLLGASAGSSGMALIAAASFHDDGFLQQLLSSLDMAAFPVEKNGQLKYCASNQVGDAALLYASVLGPLWERIRKP